MNELLPCPFCGSKAVYHSLGLIHCEDVVGCGAQMEFGVDGFSNGATRDQRIESWNMRLNNE